MQTISEDVLVQDPLLPSLRGSETNFDKLLRYFRGNEDALTPQLEKELERWKFADEQIRKYSNSDVVRILIERYKYNRITAYRDINHAQRLFGELNKTQREYARNVLYEAQLRIAKKAESIGDFKTATVALANAAKLQGLDKPDAEALDFTSIQIGQIVITGDPHLAGITDAPSVEEVRKKFRRSLKVVTDESYTPYEEED